ncbi:MAG: dihydrolipoyl dehydrogenase family protein, partial [Bacillota bacterium]
VEVRDSSGKSLNLSTNKLIIATGSVAKIPNIPGVDLPGVITSKEVLNITDLPEEVCIVGGGVIGLEFAYILNAFGAKVTVLELLPEILPKAERELVSYLLDSFREKGINILTKAQVNAIEENGPGMNVLFYHNDEEKTLETGLVLMAVGREPNLAGLDDLNLKINSGKGISVNSSMETSMPGVYAIGDVTSGVQLAHVATAQGIVAAENAIGEKTKFNSSSIPYCIYSKPEMAWVGLTEEEAKEKYGQIKVGRFSFTGSGKAMVYGDTSGLVKLIIDEKYGEIVGLHLIGPEATNMIAEGVLARMLEATVIELAATIHPHPTLSEVLMEAAHMTLDQGIHYI